MPRQGKIRDRRAKRRNHRAAMKAAQQAIIDDEALRREAESRAFDDELYDFDPDDMRQEFVDWGRENDDYEPDYYHFEPYEY